MKQDSTFKKNGMKKVPSVFSNFLDKRKERKKGKGKETDRFFTIPKIFAGLWKVIKLCLIIGGVIIVTSMTNDFMGESAKRQERIAVTREQNRPILLDYGDTEIVISTNWSRYYAGKGHYLYWDTSLPLRVMNENGVEKIPGERFRANRLKFVSTNGEPVRLKIHTTNTRRRE